MTELAQLQDQFQKFIITGHAGIDQAIVSTELVSVDTRLAIYRDGYKLRLTESLEANFPGLYLYLGTKSFHELAAAYIDTNPSHYRSIRWYGDTLADFIKHYFDKPHAYLAELADFEWKMTLSFDAADDPVVLVEDMTTVPPEAWAGLQFTLHASVQRMDYLWNVVSLWNALVRDEEIPKLEQSEHSTAWLLWRAPNLTTQFYSLSVDEAWAVDGVIQGLSFGELCEGLCQWNEPEQVGMRAATLLKNWIHKGLLARLLIN